MIASWVLKLLKQLDIHAKLNDTIQPTYLVTLFSVFSFNKEKLISSYLENSDELIEKLGLQYLGSTPQPCPSDFMCAVCDDMFEPQDTYASHCSHRFCISCFTDYLNNTLTQGRSCIVTNCPQYQCPSIIADKDFKNLLSPEQFDKFQSFLISAYVEESKLLKWCPGPNCTAAIQALNAQVTNVKCSCCNYAFCFGCNEEAHAPAGCKQVTINQSAHESWSFCIILTFLFDTCCLFSISFLLGWTNVAMKVKQLIGLLQIQRNVQNV